MLFKKWGEVKIMQTPYEYKKLIKQRILTDQIIMECICRINERTKNCRNKLQKYKNDYYFDYPYHIESYIERCKLPPTLLTQNVTSAKGYSTFSIIRNPRAYGFH